jgi:hypothetical protein
VISLPGSHDAWESAPRWWELPFPSKAQKESNDEANRNGTQQEHWRDGWHAPTMDGIKYTGLDVHKETISIAAMNSTGKLVMESIIERKASTILDCVQGIRREVHVTFEEGIMTTASSLRGDQGAHTKADPQRGLDVERTSRDSSR